MMRTGRTQTSTSPSNDTSDRPRNPSANKTSLLYCETPHKSDHFVLQKGYEVYGAWRWGAPIGHNPMGAGGYAPQHKSLVSPIRNTYAQKCQHVRFNQNNWLLGVNDRSLTCARGRWRTKESLHTPRQQPGDLSCAVRL